MWLGFVALYGAGAYLGLNFSLPNSTGATPLWPPAGIALAGLILLGRRALPLIWLGSFAAYAWFLHAREGFAWTGSAPLAAVLAFGDACEAFAGWVLCTRWLAPRWKAPDGRLRVPRLSIFSVAGIALAAAFVGAMICPAAECIAGLLPMRAFPITWLTSFVGDATSLLIITPFLLSFFAEEPAPSASLDPREAALALTCVALFTAASFGGWIHLDGRRVPVSFFIFLPLVWVALRLGIRTMTRALMILAAIGVWYTVNHLGLFAFQNPNASLLLMCMYLWAQALAGLSLTLEVAARLEAQKALAALNARLEDMIQQRTENLRSAFETIRSNEERFRAFMDNLPGLAFMKNAEGRFVYVSPRWGGLFGGETRDWLGKTDREMFPPEVAARMVATDEEILRRNEPLEVLHDVTHADGSKHQWLSNKFPIHDAKGQPRLVAGIAVDITERHLAEKGLAARMRQQTAVAQLGLRALRGGDPSMLLRGAVTQIAATLEVELCGIFELLPDAAALVLQASTGWPAGAEGSLTVPLDETSEIGYAALRREALFVPDLANEKRFRPAPEPLARGAVSAASVVIFGLGERPHGVLCAHSTRPDAFSPDDLAFLQAAANLIAMAIHRQALENEVQESSDNERARIAYDLHDGLGQELAGVSYMASVLAANLARRGSEHGADAAKVASLLRDSVKHARTIVRGLCPVKIEDGGLPAALTELTRSTEEMTGIRCRFEHDERARVDDPFVAGHLFRIAQECVHNAVKHSGAKEIAARLVTNERDVALIVEDDGVGLDQGRREGGQGLRIMKHRAGIINASLSIHSDAGGGTRVTCRTSLN